MNKKNDRAAPTPPNPYIKMNLQRSRFRTDLVICAFIRPRDPFILSAHHVYIKISKPKRLSQTHVRYLNLSAYPGLIPVYNWSNAFLGNRRCSSRKPTMGFQNTVFLGNRLCNLGRYKKYPFLVYRYVLCYVYLFWSDSHPHSSSGYDNLGIL